jgi:hypothetical protein
MCSTVSRSSIPRHTNAASSRSTASKSPITSASRCWRTSRVKAAASSLSVSIFAASRFMSASPSTHRRQWERCFNLREPDGGRLGVADRRLQDLCLEHDLAVVFDKVRATRRTLNRQRLDLFAHALLGVARRIRCAPDAQKVRLQLATPSAKFCPERKERLALGQIRLRPILVLQPGAGAGPRPPKERAMPRATSVTVSPAALSGVAPRRSAERDAVARRQRAVHPA